MFEGIDCYKLRHCEMQLGIFMGSVSGKWRTAVVEEACKYWMNDKIELQHWNMASFSNNCDEFIVKLVPMCGDAPDVL